MTSALGLLHFEFATGATFPSKSCRVVSRLRMWTAHRSKCHHQTMPRIISIALGRLSTLNLCEFMWAGNAVSFTGAELTFLPETHHHCPNYSQTISISIWLSQLRRPDISRYLWIEMPHLWERLAQMPTLETTCFAIVDFRSIRPPLYYFYVRGRACLKSRNSMICKPIRQTPGSNIALPLWQEEPLSSSVDVVGIIPETTAQRKRGG
ncbi:hypothetical protein GALMADRAFT_1033083 [Galerina marginata CBS 339.88]|uniref:Uncharacterized protein n=1 Tax=Galerina marginata (strain CBS 339.88) TaxID=685588 RepID=A0A067SLD6_GALM3|nr:hypothetical protein GALMADRAFT_1033083 [Galerina marginata CBS 339.88]